MITSRSYYKFAQILTLLVFPAAISGLWFIRVEDKVAVSGLVESSQQETVTSPYNGTVIETVFIENGDIVHVGDPLVKLKDLSGRQTKVERLNNHLKQLKQSLDALSADATMRAPRLVLLQSEQQNLLSLQNRLSTLSKPLLSHRGEPLPSTYHAEIFRLQQQEAHLQNELVKTRKLVSQNLTPAKAMDSLSFNLEQTIAQRKQAELELVEERRETEKKLAESQQRSTLIRAEIEAERNHLMHEISEAELTLKEMTRELERLVIVAPFDGRVTDVPAREYQPVTVGSPLVKISGNEPKIIICRVPESRILEVKPSQRVVIKSNLYNFLKHDVYHGVVKHIAPHGIQDDSRVYYEVTVAIQEGHDILKVGSGAGCEILVGSNPAIFLLIGHR